MRSVREEEASSRRELVELEELLILANISVVALSQLLLFLNILIQLFLGRETDSVDSLQIIIGILPKPVGSRVFRDLKSLNPVSIRHVRAGAQVNQLPTLVDRRRPTIRHLRRNERNLERIEREHLERVLLWHDESLVPLTGLNERFSSSLDLSVVIGKHLVLAHKRVVEKATVERRSEAQVRTVHLLERCAEDVRGRVPEGLTTFRVLEV